MQYICDICGTMIEKTSGYAFTTTQVATSIEYWKYLINKDKKTYGGDGSVLAMVVPMFIQHSTPWVVCEKCTAIVDADKQQAKLYASSNKKPKGCGPADQMAATMTAAYAWSLIFDEWPVSVQVGKRPVIHDPSKGSRCDFCRRILYGDEKFGIFNKETYEMLVDDGAKFIRVPQPCRQDDEGNPIWLACLKCIEYSNSKTQQAETYSNLKIQKVETKEKKSWWKFW